ncbi:MAG: peptidase, partial [Verrucomicrobiota bacterium]|nr:peptidase [Verrucomicrobiota bacterium]
QSMGGFGCWDLILRYPDLFAATVPVCGGGSPKHAARIKDISLWIFHGAKDPTVPVSASRQMAVALRDCGGRVKKYSEFPDGGHVIMESAWRAPGLIEWLFEQEK